MARRDLEITHAGYLAEPSGDGRGIHISSDNDYGYGYLPLVYRVW